MKTAIIYVLVIMVFYDLHLHVIKTIFGNQKKLMKKWYYWPPAKIFKTESDKFYNIFWTIYWAIAFILILLLLLIPNFKNAEESPSTNYETIAAFNCEQSGGVFENGECDCSDVYIYPHAYDPDTGYCIIQHGKSHIYYGVSTGPLAKIFDEFEKLEDKLFKKMLEEDWKLLKNNKYGYQLSLPESWGVIWPFGHRFDKDVDLDKYPDIEMIGSEFGYDINLHCYPEIDAFKRYGYNYKNYKNKKYLAKFKNYDAIEIILFDEETDDYLKTVLAIKNNDKLCSFEFDKYNPVHKKIINSIDFFNL